MAAVHAWKVAAALVLAAGAAFAQEPPQEPPKPPTFRLGDAATPVSYEVRFAIDPKSTAFTGEARIAFRMNRAAPVIWLNATNLGIDAAEVKQGERSVEIAVLPGGEDFVGLQAKGEPFAAGEATATLRYRGVFEAVSTRGLFRQEEGGEAYVLSQFEALNARRAMPCFDEPGWKTPWKVTIDAPAANVVVSNAPEERVGSVPDRPGWRRHEFARTKPLPSYLVALAVGPFEVVDGGTAGANRTPLRYLAPKGRGSEVRYARESTPRLLEILEEYFGIPYPFEKLDSVVIPQAVGFGAMENVGLITYDARLLLATPLRETPRFRRTYASYAAHEIAHMWFGNYVTLAWWDDIWLNEAFATWMGEKARYRLRPEWDTGEYRARARASAIATDRLASARRVRNPVNVRDDMGGAFSSITYQKGAAVLEMFERSVGAETFQRGVRDFLKRHAYGSATSAGFFRAVGSAVGRTDTVTALEAFVDQPGVPLIEVASRCEGGGGVLAVSQARLRPKGSRADDREWTTPACFRWKGGSVCEPIRNAPATISLPSCPDWILGNADGSGHYVVRYDDALLKRIVRVGTTLPVREMAALLSDTLLLAQSGLIPMATALELADVGLRHASHVVRLGAVRILHGLPDARLDAGELRKKREIVARRLQPLARQVGWKEAEKDPEELRDLRRELLPLAARSPGGAALRKEARAFMLVWQRREEAIPATVLPAILDTAARFADRASYDLLESLAVTEHDAVERRQLHSALAKVRDPALLSRALGLILKKTAGADVVSGRDALLVLQDALEDEANRAAAFEFVRANFEPLVAKLPQHSPGQFATYARDFCTPAERDTFVAFFKDRASRFLGGQRRYEEALETIELCIASRSGT